MTKPEEGVPEEGRPVPEADAARDTGPVKTGGPPVAAQDERLGSVRWAMRIGAMGLAAAALFNLVAYVQTGAWQMLFVLAATLFSVAGLFVANRLASRGRLEAARNALLAAMVLMFASGELVHTGLTLYLAAGGILLILLVGIVLVPGKWWRSGLVAAVYGGYVALVNWLEPLPRYDVRQLGLQADAFVLALLAFLIVAALFLIGRFYQRLISIRVRLPVSFVLVVLGSIVVIASVGAVVGSQGGRRQALNQLESVARMKEAEIEQWMGRVERALDEALAGGQLTARMVLILEKPEPTDTELFYPRNYLQYTVQESEFFDDFALVDPQGKVRLFTGVSGEASDSLRQVDPRPGLEGFHLQPVLYATDARLVAMRPIVDDDGQPVGVLAGVLNTSSLSELMGERAWLGSTGEMYLADRSRRVLTDLRFGPLSRAVLDTRLELLGVAEQANRSLVYADYRGEQVVGVLHWLPELDMALVAKQDVAESAAVTNQLMRVIALVSVGAFVVAMVVSMLMTRSITRPLAELTGTAEKIARGDLSPVPALAQRDEIGTLSRTLAGMTAQIHDLIDSLEERVADRTRELERRSAYLEASAEVGRVATSILDPNRLISDVVELIRDRFGLYYVGLFVVDEAGEWAVLRAGTGPAGQLMLQRGHRVRLGTGIVGWSIVHARSRVAEEAAADGPSTAWGLRLATPELPETRSEAALPLRSRGQVLGALTVQDSQPAAFDEDMLAALQTVADQVAVAIDNARLLDESQRALKAEQQAYGEISREAWLRLIETRQVLGYRSNEAGLSAVDGMPSPLATQAAMTRQAVVSEPGSGGEPGRESGLAVPLLIRDQLLGVLHFRKGEADQAPWSRDEIALAEGLAEQLGQALESARLYQDSQLRAGRERLAAEVTTRLRESLEVRTVLEAAAEELYRSLGLEQVVIRLSGDEEGIGHADTL